MSFVDYCYLRYSGFSDFVINKHGDELLEQIQAIHWGLA